MGLPLSDRFAEALGKAEQKQSQEQMTHKPDPVKEEPKEDKYAPILQAMQTAIEKQAETISQLSKPKKIMRDENGKIIGVSLQEDIKALEQSVNKQVEELNTTGYDRLPGVAGKRDSDIQQSGIEQLTKRTANTYKNKPSELEKVEVYLRRVKKLPEEEVDKIMEPLWMNYGVNPNPKEVY